MSEFDGFWEDNHNRKNISCPRRKKKVNSRSKKKLELWYIEISSAFLKLKKFQNKTDVSDQ